jgi:predicted transglutaminase-like cysteine proteinase
MRRLAPLAAIALAAAAAIGALSGARSAIGSLPDQVAVQFDPSRGKWPDLVARMRAQEPMLAACVASGDCAHELRAWREVAREASRRRGRDRLAYVNAGINRLVTYRADQENYGVADYWASLAETMARGGDCEDIAIAKLWTLKLAGEEPHGLKLLELERRDPHEVHMVLLARAGGRAYVLDNQARDLVPAEISAGTPIYTVSLAGAETFAQPVRIADYLKHQGWWR